MKKLKAAVIGCGNISVMHLDYVKVLKIQKIISGIYNNNDTRDWYAGCV